MKNVTYILLFFSMMLNAQKRIKHIIQPIDWQLYPRVNILENKVTNLERRLDSLVTALNPIPDVKRPTQVNVTTIDWGKYEPITNVPNYLESVVENEIKITRISDYTAFGCDCSQLRHRYSKNRAWNADETLIMTSGSPAKLLDATTYEVVKELRVKAIWSNTNPELTYDVAGNATFVSKNVITEKTNTLLNLSHLYDALSFGNNEGNLSNDDRYAALIGYKSGNQTIMVYDLLDNKIVSTKYYGKAPIDWIGISQLGNYVVVMFKNNGSGSWQGTKSFTRDLQNEVHLVNGHPHADIGIDQEGKEVLVHYGNTGDSKYSLGYTNLKTGETKKLFYHTDAFGDRGLYGGHISTRNIDRPGWAYVSDQGHPTDVNKHEATREMFAIKLDASGIIERFGKHHNKTINNLHDSQGVVNKDGTKILFATNFDNSNYLNKSYPIICVAEKN